MFSLSHSVSTLLVSVMLVSVTSAMLVSVMSVGLLEVASVVNAYNAILLTFLDWVILTVTR